MSNFWNYFAECARLLYWIYFKPYTFEKWLQTIHPYLKSTDNPYRKFKEFPHNQNLRRYANQLFWLTIILTQLAITIVGVIYTVLTPNVFDWLISEVFVVIWISYQVICRFGYGLWGRKLLFLTSSIFLLAIVIDLLLNTPIPSLAIFMVWNTSSSILLGVVLGGFVGV